MHTRLLAWMSFMHSLRRLARRGQNEERPVPPTVLVEPVHL